MDSASDHFYQEIRELIKELRECRLDDIAGGLELALYEGFGSEVIGALKLRLKQSELDKRLGTGTLRRAYSECVMKVDRAYSRVFG